MLPLVLNSQCVSIALIGAGAAAVRRLDWLLDSNAKPAVYAPGPDPILAAKAGRSFTPRLPDNDEIAGATVLFIAGLDVTVAGRICEIARGLGRIVNVEDVVALCDAHVPAVVRRGDLLLTVSTGGKSPGLAARIRQSLDHLFPPVWTERVHQLAHVRNQARSRGATGAELRKAVDTFISEQGWL